ncbi:MAG TPA: helix-turn-helix transcriptional regulator [Ktedonobacteraceae bacterium]|nr:helix-turn-helix transcriptional regulator [Ktedonobacteraceae bacterium]
MAKLIIKEVAKSRGLNQSQLGLKAAVTPQLLNRYWNNHTRSVALDQLELIAKALGVKPGDLIVSDEASMEDAA